MIGAAGGTKITSGVAIGMALNLWFNYDIKEAIDARRLHHQVSWTSISTSKKRSILSLSLFDGQSNSSY